MRVAFVSVSDQMGGSEAVLLDIVRGLTRSRASWDLHLIVPGGGPLTQSAQAAGAAVSVVGMPASIAGFGERAAVNGRPRSLPAQLVRAAFDVPGYQRALDAAMARVGPDLVHTNGFKAHVFAARRPSGAALVWHVHEYVSGRPMTRALLRRYAPRCDALVTNSDSVAADVRAAIDGVPVSTIPNAVDLDRFSPEGPTLDLDAQAGLARAAPGTIRVGLPATFAQWKGHGVFLEALASLPPDAPIRGYVVGGPVYDTRGSQVTVAELQARARELHLQDRVGFTGFVDAPAAALRALDIVVHASTDPEPFGMVIAEAMACGRAVITTGAGGAGELVRDGVDAVVHRRGDVRHLAERIAALVEDASLRARLGAAARATAVERFDARRMTEQFGRLYEETLAQKRSRP